MRGILRFAFFSAEKNANSKPAGNWSFNWNTTDVDFSAAGEHFKNLHTIYTVSAFLQRRESAQNEGNPLK